MKNLCIIFFVLFCYQTNKAQVLESDSLALVDLYYATDGPNWNNNSNWLEGPVEYWHGITLLGDRVYMLKLQNNGLGGHIPASIGDLTGLIEIDFYDADFTGSIPPEIGSLPDLYQIDLRFCGLTGEIPATLGNCLQLGRLHLADNQLTGTIPMELSSCVDMIQLDVSDNLLSGPFPAVLESFSQLEQLDLSSNSFTGSIPEWIASLTNLYVLYLEGIPFDGPMPPLGSKPNLQQLYITNNEVTGKLEDILDYYPNLAYCAIENTNISGRLGPEYFNANSIAQLSVIFSEIDELGSFAEWNNHPNFIRMFVNDNHLDFDDLVPNSSLPVNKFFWFPQEIIGNDTTVYLFPNQPFTFQSPMQNNEVVYDWYKDNILQGFHGPELEFAPFMPEDAGTYYFEARHPSLPAYYLTSATITVEAEPTSTDAVAISSTNLYPNPASDQLFINHEDEIVYSKYSLLTLQGQLLQSENLPADYTSIEIGHLTPGIYLIRLEGRDGTELKRFVKQ